ncbi:MFS transporter [Natronomonas salina]|uniref:MFS transporter n=1 Tax=Natronomonas salina TaxID=1710540 RepID=UPI0015B4F941|nr:MFS transporter [Natronomonas salina]QLD88270.1 MFS transporter [Natronomonas salina]
MPRSHAPLVVGLVSGSHVVNHAYLLLFAPAFSLLSGEFDASLAALGLTIGVVNGVVTAGQLPLGYISDSYSHAAVLIGCLVVGSLGCALSALAPTYEWLLVAAGVMGLGVAGHHPAHYPLISAAAPESYRSRAYSAHGFAGAVGLAVPYAAVPAAVALGYGWRAAFLAIAALGFCYAGVAALVVRRLPASITRAGAQAREDDPAPFGSADTPRERLRDLRDRFVGYLRMLAGAPLILALTALWFVNSAAIWGVRSYAATLLDAGYGVDAGTASLVASAMLVVGAVVLLGGGYLADRIGPLPMLFAGYGSLVVLAGLLSTALLPALAAVGVVLLLAATVDLSRPARSTLTDLASERRDVGKNFALMTIGISAGGAVAPPVFGYVIEQTDVWAAFVGVAATAAVALGLSLLVARTVRDGA